MAMMQLPAFQPPQMESPGNMMTRMAQMQAMQDASEEKRYLIEQRAAAQQWRQGLNALVERSGGEMTPELLAHFVKSPDPAAQKFGLEGLADLRASNAYAKFNAPPQEQPPLFEGRAPTQNFLGIRQGFDTPERQPLSVGNELAPTRAASAFRPVSLDDKISMLADRRDRMIAFANMYPKSTIAKNAMEEAKLIAGQINNLQTTGRPLTVQPGGALVDPQGRSLFSQPALPTPANITYLPGRGSVPGQVAIARVPRGPGDPDIEFRPLPQGVGARVQEPPPRTETIQDPTTGRDMLVDVSATGFNPELGSKTPGFLGFKGESPAQAKARLKTEQAEEDKQTSLDAFRGELNNTRLAYGELDRLKAIPSTERSGLSNLSASMGASGVGQTLGRTFGTEEQKNRDVIAGSRLRLLNSVAKVLGVKSGQLNSNVELQTYLKSLSDPTQSIQAVEENIANLEAFIQRNLGKAPSEPPPKTTAPKPAAPKPAALKLPKPGDVVDGYRFIGGAPNDQKNWVKQ